MHQYSHMRSRVRRRTKARPLSPSTGIWNLAYDANDRPISFTSEDGQTVIACDYDYMGRRFMKKITIGGSITVHQRYLYRGYLQIAALDMLHTQALLHRIHWDPTEASATRPLSIRKNETWYSYGQDLTKNVTELYKADGTIASTYDYSPYGAVTATGIEQPLQWSSEVYDSELGMVYYNYRHYNPRDGRWINRDPIAEQGGWNLYLFIKNNSLFWFDQLGLWKKVNGKEHTWCAEKGDTLRGLAKSQSQSEEDYQCLWPTGNTRDHGYPNNIHEGDTYDASNLQEACSANIISLETASDLQYEHEQAYGRTLMSIAGTEVASHIKTKSLEGGAPITNLFVGGHGVHYEKGIMDGIGMDKIFFNSEQLLLLNQAPTYERSKQKKGPLRCWFSRKSVIKFTGCTTNALAAKFAQKILRKGSVSWGTLHTICHSKKVKWYELTSSKWQLKYESEGGSWVGQGNGALPTQSRTWIQYAGIL